MLALLRRLFAGDGRCLTGPLGAAFILLVTAACGTEAPGESTPAPPAPAAPAPADVGTAQIVGRAPPANGAVGSVILLDPHADIDVPLPGEVPVMDQYGRMFYPLFLLVRKGQTIRFTNSEDDLHTVHVKDSAGESLFNIATLFGSSYEFTFDREDSYDVECNTHTEMAADILVVSSPYAVLADSDGAFTLPNVIPGTYTVTLLNGEDRRERDVEIVAGRNEIDLRVRAEINPTDLSQQCHQLEMCFCRHDSIVPIHMGFDGSMFLTP